jgi:3-deoxy-D-manno-octulosonic-acid transferase
VRFIYTLLAYLSMPIAMLNLLLRGLRGGGWGELIERFGGGAGGAAEQCIWVHAVSLGEVNAAASLLRALRDEYPGIPLVLTTGTRTGQRRARDLFAPSVTVRFAPYDLPGPARRFLDSVKPRVAIIMETELWPNLLSACARRDIPILIANARISARSWPRYRKLRALFAPVLSGNVVVAAQTGEDARRFGFLGASGERTHIIGNLKFDIDIDTASLEKGAALRASFLGRPVWIAGSTHGGEDELVLMAHALVRSSVPPALLILVPRHPSRFDAVADLLARGGWHFVRRSSNDGVGGDTEVLLADTVGELVALYAAANVAFVGGSLVPIGGHNLLEPAALAMPVTTGPFNSNSPDVVKLLSDRGALLRVTDSQGLASAVSRLLEDAGERERLGALALSAVDENRGALARTLSLLRPYLRGHG